MSADKARSTVSPVEVAIAVISLRSLLILITRPTHEAPVVQLVPFPVIAVPLVVSMYPVVYGASVTTVVLPLRNDHS